jgi:hypothetical protein
MASICCPRSIVIPSGTRCGEVNDARIFSI